MSTRSGVRNQAVRPHVMEKWPVACGPRPSSQQTAREASRRAYASEHLQALQAGVVNTRQACPPAEGLAMKCYMLGVFHALAQRGRRGSAIGSEGRLLALVHLPHLPQA